MIKSLKQAKAAIALLNPKEIRHRAERNIHLGLVASTPSAYTEMVDFLSPNGISRSLVHRADDDAVPTTVDLVVYEHALDAPDGAYTFDRTNPSAMVQKILKDHEDFALPLANHFPSFRHQVIDDIIQE